MAVLAGLTLGLAVFGAPAATMHFPGREWSVVQPEAEALDAAKLGEAVDFLKARAGRDGVRELLIVRNGRIVWQGEVVTNVHGVWSVTKSFTSTCLGLLVDDGRCALETPAASLVPALAAHYSGVTLRHLATMTSGYRAQGDDPRAEGYTHGPSPTPFTPGREPLFPPGAAYAYWDSAMNLFGLALTRAAGEPLDALFRRRIADPIQMDPAGWRWGDFGSIGGLRVNGGAGNHNRHVFINARELARLGHLFLNEGRWNGRPLLSSNWVRAATAIQVPATLTNAWPRSGIAGPGVYGFNWWRNGVRPDGRRLWPGAPAETFAALGHNNNKLIVIPPWRMVVVRLGLDQADRVMGDDTLDGFLRRLGEARQDAPELSIAEGEHEGRPQLVIHAPSATWHLDRAGGGFSRLLDRDGRDWISFRKEPLAQFPESAGAGYPGFDRCASALAASNVIRVTTLSGRWAWTWTFRGDTARFRMEKAASPQPWWFLYEGTVGGRWSPATHYWGTDEGGPRRDTPDLKQPRFGQWRWAYFGDDTSPRVLFIAQAQPDALPDTLYYLGAQDGGAVASTDGMIVFGFGRGPNTTPQLRGAGQEFIIGFREMRATNAASHQAIAAAIQALLEP